MYKKVFSFFLLLTALFIAVSFRDIYDGNKDQFSLRVEANAPNIQIKQRNPVVNEGNRILLTAIDSSGTPLNNGVTWKSGSPDIAQVEANTGQVSGIKTGFATITATQGTETVSVFVAVAKVRKANGSTIPGDTKTDSEGTVYISNPVQNVIFRADKTLNSKLKVFAGKLKVAGNKNGQLEDALFAGPTAIGVDNRDKGGLYIADTLNHSVRKIGFNKQVETIIGKGTPGVTQFNNNLTNFDQVLLNSPRGIVTDNGGNLYIADTDNHAIYYIDFSLKQVFLIAGKPGESGKEDGLGQSAKFRRPSGMALSSDGRLLTVADEDNNRVRLIEILNSSEGVPTGRVSTLSKSEANQVAELSFNRPQSVGIDGLGNIYVADKTGVQIITQSQAKASDIVSLAQADVTFNQAISLTLKGSEVFVLDNGVRKTEALKVVSIGGPEITNIQPDTITLEETREVVVRGKNFAPQTQVVVGGQLAQSVSVISAEELRFRVAAPKVPGKLTLSILTRGGLAQSTLSAIALPLSSIAVGEITTVTGGRIFTGDGGKATESGLAIPTKIITDSRNNLFIAELRNVRRVDANTGIITTIAGGGDSFDDNILATTSSLQVLAITLNKNGNLVVADGIGNRIREIDSLTNKITTIAGGNGFISSGDGGLAINAGFRDIRDIAFDQNGNLLILELTRLRRVDSKTGIINTIAGNGEEKFAGDNGPAQQASFLGANSLALDNANNIFICELFSERVRKIDSQGIITTVAGNGRKEDSINRNGKPATQVGLFIPDGIAISPDGKLFISDFGGDTRSNGNSLTNEILQVDLKTGILTSKAVKFTNFDVYPPGLTVGKLSLNGLGNLFFTAVPNFAYRFNFTTAEAIPVAGNKNFNLSGDDILAQKAAIGTVEDAVLDSKNNLYIADYSNGLVRKIDANTRQITTIVGKDTSNTVGNGDGGLAINAVCFPYSIAIDNQDNLLIADNRDNARVGSRVRKVDFKTGIITSVAGNGDAQDVGDNGPALKAGFSFIFEIAVDSKNNIYTFTTSTGGTLRRIDANTGIVTFLRNEFYGFGMTVDKAGNIIFASGKNATIINQLNPTTGQIITIAGNDQEVVSGDGGLAKDAGLGTVGSLSFDNAGNLFILVFDSKTTAVKVRRIDAQTKIITTIAGTDIDDYFGDGKAALNAGLSRSRVLVNDSQGNLFITVNDLIEFNAVRFVKLAAR